MTQQDCMSIEKCPMTATLSSLYEWKRDLLPYCHKLTCSIKQTIIQDCSYERLNKNLKYYQVEQSWNGGRIEGREGWGCTQCRWCTGRHPLQQQPAYPHLSLHLCQLVQVKEVLLTIMRVRENTVFSFSSKTFQLLHSQISPLHSHKSNHSWESRNH